MSMLHIDCCDIVDTDLDRYQDLIDYDGHTWCWECLENYLREEKGMSADAAEVLVTKLIGGLL